MRRLSAPVARKASHTLGDIKARPAARGAFAQIAAHQVPCGLFLCCDSSWISMRALISFDESRAASRLKVPKRFVLIAMANSTMRPRPSFKAGAMTSSLPCLVVSTTILLRQELSFLKVIRTTILRRKLHCETLCFAGELEHDVDHVRCQRGHMFACPSRRFLLLGITFWPDHTHDHITAICEGCGAALSVSPNAVHCRSRA